MPPLCRCLPVEAMWFDTLPTRISAQCSVASTGFYSVSFRNLPSVFRATVQTLNFDQSAMKKLLQREPSYRYFVFWPEWRWRLRAVCNMDVCAVESGIIETGINL